MTTRKSVLGDVEELRLAIELVELGARLQVLESEVSISRDRLTRLYKELRGVSPPKGQLPSSPEWFLTWRQNVHSSLFLCAYRSLMAQGGGSRIKRSLSAYRLYAEQVRLSDEEPVLSFTRAWTMLRFLDSGTLATSTCGCCGGPFVRHNYDLRRNFVCGLCAPPPRAAKKKPAVAVVCPVGLAAADPTMGVDPALIARQEDRTRHESMRQHLP